MNRWDIINKFIQDRNYKSYLEIGVSSGECFRHIKAERKVSVDTNPNTNATYNMTSDEYFKAHRTKYDVIFIDGLHTADQAHKDINCAIAHLNPGGIVVVHDCHPETELMQQPYTNQHFWTGDVWKAFVVARKTLPYECYVLDWDFGCGIIDTSRKRTANVDDLPDDICLLCWRDFTEHPEWFDFRREVLS